MTMKTDDLQEQLTAWTIGALRAELTQLPEDTPLLIQSADEPGAEIPNPRLVDASDRLQPQPITASFVSTGDQPTGFTPHAGYLAAVARELHLRGLAAQAIRTTGPSTILTSSIEVDCTLLQRAARAVPPDGLTPEWPTRVTLAWTEDSGWHCQLRHNSDNQTVQRCYLHADLVSSPGVVADFVQGLALGHRLGMPYPDQHRYPNENHVALITELARYAHPRQPF